MNKKIKRTTLIKKFMPIMIIIHFTWYFFIMTNTNNNAIMCLYMIVLDLVI